MQRSYARERNHSDLSGKVDWGASVALDAERAVLGLLLQRGDIWELLEGKVVAKAFYEPLHRQIFQLIEASRSKGLAFSRERLETVLGIDRAFAAAGGARYVDLILSDAAGAEISLTDPTTLADLVRDLWVRREVIAACQDVAGAAKGNALTTGKDLQVELERRLTTLDFTVGRHEGTPIEKALETIVAGKPADLISTGYRKIDRQIGKVERGDFVLLAARPSMGKSALASCIARVTSQLRYPGHEGEEERFVNGVAFINGEMSEAQMSRRLITDQCHEMFGDKSPSYSDIRQDKVSEIQKPLLVAAKQAFGRPPLLLFRQRRMTITELCSMARRIYRKWQDAGIRMALLIVDHIGIILPTDPRANGVEAMKEIGGRLKDLAVELNIGVLGLAQLNRQVENRDDKRPQLSDLRDSGTLEQDADVVLALYREAYYAQRESEPAKNKDRLEWLQAKASKTIECLGLKVREGQPGMVELWGDVARNAIRDEEPPPEPDKPNPFDFSKL